MTKRLLVVMGVLFTQLLAGCAVYMPIQCAAPQIKGRKESEVTGSTYLNGRYEVAAAYSPVRHLLVRAAYSSLPKGSDDSTYYHGRQYEVAAGTYWPLGADSRWLLGGLAGFGQAHSEARFPNVGGIIYYVPLPPHAFDARYNKWFGEAYGSYQASPCISFGAAYRVTRVHFTLLTDVGQPLRLRGMTRSEPMFFFRVRPGTGPADARPVQLQMTWGSSSTFGYTPATSDLSDSGYNLQKSRGYLTVGISLLPHCLMRLFRQTSRVN